MDSKTHARSRSGISVGVEVYFVELLNMLQGEG
jgi:hypothetical protein